MSLPPKERKQLLADLNDRICEETPEEEKVCCVKNVGYFFILNLVLTKKSNKGKGSFNSLPLNPALNRSFYSFLHKLYEPHPYTECTTSPFTYRGESNEPFPKIVARYFQSLK